MAQYLDIILISLILTDLMLLGASRMWHLTQMVALQGALLALVPLFSTAPGNIPMHLALLCLAVFSIKALAFPVLLARTARRVGVTSMVEPYLGFSLSVACGIAGLLFSFWLESRLSLPGLPFTSLLLPASITTIIAGLLLIIGRRKALTQVIGYLVMENGIFLFGSPAAEQGSVWMELSILLDVFVAVFVMGIAILNINRTFESIDVDRFCSLRD